MRLRRRSLDEKEGKALGQREGGNEIVIERVKEKYIVCVFFENESHHHRNEEIEALSPSLSLIFNEPRGSLCVCV